MHDLDVIHARNEAYSKGWRDGFSAALSSPPPGFAHEYDCGYEAGRSAWFSAHCKGYSPSRAAIEDRREFESKQGGGHV